MLTISTTRSPATDLGYILHKHPDRVQEFPVTYGVAHVFYPVATAERCTAALVVEIDPIKLTRRGNPNNKLPEEALQDYVNDRPYVASSHLVVAMADVFSTAMSGRCKPRPELPETILPLEAKIASVPCRWNDDLIHRLFTPLGYQVTAEPIPLDDQFPEWGNSRYYNLTLTADKTVRDLLHHLYVLIPVLDNSKHYWIGQDEVDKLLRMSEGWLDSHPAKDIILRRYLRHRRNLVDQANTALAEAQENAERGDPDDAAPEPEAEPEAAAIPAQPREPSEADIEKPMRLSDMRIAAVNQALTQCGATDVVDLGCGEGQLLEHLIKEPKFKRILGADVSTFAIAAAERKLRLRQMNPDQRKRIDIIQTSLIYRDQRIHGFQAAVAMEVIEHIDPPKLTAFSQVVLGEAQPTTLVITTPNIEYNALFTNMRSSGLRHRDHRFEWTREEFNNWATATADQYGYQVRVEGIGNEDPEHGHPTQMAIFTR